LATVDKERNLGYYIEVRFFRSSLMALTVMKKRYQVVLDLELLDDLDPYDVDWQEKISKSLDLQPDESVTVVKIKEEDNMW